MYQCWMCGLWYGEPGTPVESTHLCPTCITTVKTFFAPEEERSEDE